MNNLNIPKKKVLIFIVSYNAERFIENVLKRIPAEVLKNNQYSTEVLIIDDCSQDRTFYVATDISTQFQSCPVTVLYNPKNQGYGGNQKIGYYYAILHHFDVVVLLHGDGQYPPEYIHELIQPILLGEADVVFGSRMLRKKDALRGKMPVYKWIGNQILTLLQNKILGSHLSEFHTGYRAYSVSALSSIPFDGNSDYYDFDTDIIIQMVDLKKRIKEIPIPTFYGEEISRVNGTKYAYKIMMACILSRFQKWGLFYHPKFDYILPEETYVPKFGFTSSHQFAYDRVKPETTVLDLGCGPGFMAAELSGKRVKTISIDRQILPEARDHSFQAFESDLDGFDFNSITHEVETILALDIDIIEHLEGPENFLRRLRERFSPSSPDLIISTANVGFFLTRLSLLLGQFNYGRRGILDAGHKRLFTFSSLRRTLILTGYEILVEKGIPAPFPLAFGRNWFAKVCLLVNRCLIKLSQGLFSYQIAMIARPKPTLNHLLQDAKEAKKCKLEETTINC